MRLTARRVGAGRAPRRGPALLAALLLALVLLRPPGIASADCDDPGAGCAFLLADSVLVPPAFGGLPAWRVAACYAGARDVPLADRFAVERRTQARWIAVPFRVRLAFDTPAIADWPARAREQLLLLAPEEGFLAGATYRFTRKEASGIPAAAVLVRVARATPAPDTAGTRLRIGDAATGPLVFGELPGGGYPTFRAVQRRVELRLPAAWAPFAGALLVSTRVDGEPWRPRIDACRTGAPPGSGALGRGLDVLFAPCGGAAAPGPDGLPIPVPHALTIGRHAVEMRAWLPGTDVVLHARTDATLACP